MMFSTLPKQNVSRKLNCFSLLVMSILLFGCQSTREIHSDVSFMPYIGGNAEANQNTPITELRQLQLISTNLVSALVQIPEMSINTTTVQISSPRSALGNSVIKALEDAGFSIQRVAADQGQNFVTYDKRVSETQQGLVTDYGIAIGEIEIRREYEVRDDRLFPSSLLVITGTDEITDIVLDDNLFTEQGGNDDAFLSGVSGDTVSSPVTDVNAVTVRDYDAVALERRTSHSKFLSSTQQRMLERDSINNRQKLTNHYQVRRTVLLFDKQNGVVMGRGNKQAVRQLADTYLEGDILAITACNDADGKDDAAQSRAIRVLEEFIGHGVPSSAVQIEPCIQANYRHVSDGSPVAVTVVQYWHN